MRGKGSNMTNATQSQDTVHRGVKLSLISMSDIDGAIGALQLKPKKGDITAKVDALVDYAEAKGKAGADIGDCNNCGGPSLLTLDCCPFCGHEDEDEEEAAPEPEKAAPKAETPKAATPPAPAPPRRVRKPSAPSPAPVEAKVEPKVEEPAKKQQAPVPVKKNANGHIAKVQTEKDLDDAVQRVRTCFGATGAAYYQLGVELKHIFENELYKQRKVDGKAAYRSWDAFLHAEVGMSTSAAWDAMQIVARMSKDQVEKLYQFGKKKIAFVVRAPEEARDEMIKQIEGGATKEQIEKEYKAAREKHGAPESAVKKKVDTSNKGSFAKGGATQAAKVSNAKRKKLTDKITVASILNKPQRVFFFTSASMKGPANERKPQHAQMFKDIPIGTFEMANDVTGHILLKKTKKGIEAVLNFKCSE